MAESDLVPVEIMLSRAEKAALDESAVREGASTADYLRRAVLYVLKLEDQIEKLDPADAASIVRAASAQGSAGAEEAGEGSRSEMEALSLQVRRAEERYLALERRTARLETLIELTSVGALPGKPEADPQR